jgi:uncharacterized protein YpmB
MIAVGVVSVLLVVVTAANWVGKRRAMRDADEAHRNLVDLVAEQADDRVISDNLNI